MRRLLARPSALATAIWAISNLVPANAQQPGFARVFDDHMVLQRGEPCAVWGWGTAGEQAVVRFGGQEHTATVDTDGRWAVRLDPLAASAEGRALTLALGGARFALQDVVVGEVWVCGGQSNMAWTLRSSRDADLELACADDPLLRYVRLPLEARGEPRRDYVRPEHGGQGKGWRVIDADAARDCTAVGYYFAQRLRRHLKVPVGLVDVSWGGTLAQFWVSKSRLRTFASVQPEFERYQRELAAWIEGGREQGAIGRYQAALAEWERACATAREAGEREPRKPGTGAFENPAHKRHPGGGYDGMLAPLRGLSIRGALYFQGENNAFGDMYLPFPDTYPAVIAEWRELFGDAALPIGLIQIGGWSTRRTMTYDMNHHTNAVREVQFDTWRRTPHTGLVVTFDLNSDANIHPGHKRPVGERAARWALAEVYAQKGHDGKPLRWRGPIYASSEVKGDRIVVRFEEGTANGLRLDKSQALGFYLAGEDREFHVADARVVDGSTVEVFCAAVPAPIAVRYAWSNLPLGTLMNGKELPAYPFRSDDWPLRPHRSEGSYVRRR
jgi:sialate O-acetylesterase